MTTSELILAIVIKMQKKRCFNCLSCGKSLSWTMCFYLLGANVNRATANNDHTVVSLACAGGHLAVVELLLAHGADPTHRLKVMLSLLTHYEIFSV